MHLRRLVSFALLLGLGLGWPIFADDAAMSSHQEEIRQWRERRLVRLQADTGYLALAGLYWLEEGESSFGSDKSNDVIFPPHGAPAKAGVFVRKGQEVRVRAFPGTALLNAGKPVQEMLLASDATEEPTRLELGDLSFMLIERSGRYAIRLRDKQSPIRKNFHGIENYPVDAGYRLRAKFEPYDPMKPIAIVNVVGLVDTMYSPGSLVFSLQGKECRLDPVLESPADTTLFIIFRDATSGDETYGDGRFLYTSMPAAGQVIVDFNKAYNPPCAFSPYTTCPLPPRQNELEIPVRAGEKAYAEK